MSKQNVLTHLFVISKVSGFIVTVTLKCPFMVGMVEYSIIFDSYNRMYVYFYKCVDVINY